MTLNGRDQDLFGKKILVVDDERLFREAVVFDLKKRGCQVFEADNGIDAYSIVLNEALDIVLTDIRMPEYDGITLLSKIRESHPLRPRVLLISGYVDLTEKEALKRGAVALLDKPINRKEMLSLIAKNC